MTKFGAVSYLNTKPLIYSMERDFVDFQQQKHQLASVDHLVDASSVKLPADSNSVEPGDSLILDLPSRLADRLVAGDLDVALIPIVETFLHPELEIISNACIACSGPVWSVKLLSQRPIEEIQSVALDEGSRTSAMMVRVLLHQSSVGDVRFENLPIEKDWREMDTDAVLIIGDRAMNCQSDRFSHQWDLGQWWNESQQLPFVFAVWAGHKPFAVEPVLQTLQQSRDEGCRHLMEIAKAHASGYGLTVQRCFDYLKKNLHFEIGPQEKVAIETFFRMATELELVPHKREMLFHD